MAELPNPWDQKSVPVERGGKPQTPKTDKPQPSWHPYAKPIKESDQKESQ